MIKLRTIITTSSLSLALVLSACSENSNAQVSTTSTSQSANKQTTPQGNSNDPLVSALQANLKKSGVELTVKSATPTSMDGIYWVSFDEAPPMFSDAKGEHLIQGQIANIGGERPVDITAALQSTLTKEKLTKVDPTEMITFPATNETKAAIYVFFDPTCHYCQKLHSEIDDINAQGIEVRYLAWPRNDRFIELTEAIWCSNNRQDALTRAKEGENITAPACDNPVRSHIELGHQIGVSGTPAVFTESGRQIGGYLPAKELAKLAIEYKD
ncbi:DsbC family protein [Moraxella haemolytica]|uniref:DsbC family protein n=1 Tax=Moraxella haemolytica TaxID=2904119 RepID=UPI002543F08C|nr:DsbC family protein [Moraxella sp. ZY171148]WII95761.1 DsbC family protein [Moraxella sp. ZY171148]